MTFESAKLTEVKGYIDSDYATNMDNQKSTSGYIFTYDGTAISWRSKLQYYTTLSTIEGEYVAASKVATEAIWLHQLLADFLATS